MARKVSTAKAHGAFYGETQKFFSTAADNANPKKDLSMKLKAKRIQDRYKKIQDAFYRKEKKGRLLSSVGGQIGELEELLLMVGEACNDIEKEKRAELAAAEEREAREERIGKDLVARALFLFRGDNGEIGNDSFVFIDDADDAEGQGNGHGRSRKRPRHRPVDSMDGELEGFGKAFRDADLARIELDRERLQLERGQFERESEKRAKDREERREEREAQNEVDLMKMKLMMDAFTRRYARGRLSDRAQ